MNQITDNREGVFDAQAVTTATVKFFKRWWKLLLGVFILAAVVSTVVSLFIKPMYLSYGTMLPINTNRLSKAIMDYDYSLDYLDYGAEKDCEYALQILTSKQMELAVAERFDLVNRYEIKASSKHKMYDVGKKYNRYLTIKRTDFMGIQVAIVDKDPQVAADIVNYIMDKYDTLCHEVHHERSMDAARLMSKICDEEMANIDTLASQVKDKQWKDQLVKRKCKKLAEMQARAAQTAADMDFQAHYRFVVDRAVPSDKKDRPKRAMIVVGSSVGTLVVCIFGLLIFAPRRKEDYED